MSIWIGNFKLPDIDRAQCVPPRAFELQRLRMVGLNPEEWLLVKLPCHIPFVVLRKRCDATVFLVLSRRTL